MNDLATFLIQWAITSLSLWVCSHVFKGIKFENTQSLIIAALLLGFANAIVRPVLFVVTFPLTLITLGLFYLIINALMIKLVAWMVKGFKLSGFWTAFFASIFISLLSFVFGAFVGDNTPPMQPPTGGTWM